MRLTFFPDFKSRTRVLTGPGLECVKEESSGSNDSTSVDDVKVVFTAKLDARDYDEFVRSEARLEAWTNAPTPHDGSRAGEWGAIQFVRGDVESASSDGGEEVSEQVLYLDESTPSRDSHSSEPHSPYITFHAYTKIPRAPPKRFYGLTYRIVYPSGVFWLGTPTTNALLEATSAPSDDNLLFDELGNWIMSSEKGIRVLSEQSEVACDSDKVIGNLNMRDFAWKGWSILGITAETFVLSPHAEIPPSRLIFLIPEAKSTTDTILVPRPIVLRTTSWHSPISVSCQGSIIFHSEGDGTVERHSHIPGSREYMTLLESDAVSACPGPEIIALTEDTLVLNPANQSSVSAIIYVLPLKEAVNDYVKISTSSLAPFLRNAKSVLFNSETKSSIFVDNPKENGKDIVAISVGNSGGQFIISPVYDITSSDGKNAWELSLLGSPVFPELIVNESSNPLPTPPASPPPRPRQSVSFILPEETSREKGKAVVPSTRRPSEDRTEWRPPSPGRVAPPTLGLGLISTLTHIHDILMLRFHAFMMRGPIRSHIFAIFSVATWLLGAVVRKAFSYTMFVFPLRRRAITRRRMDTDERSSSGAYSKGFSASERHVSTSSSTVPLNDECSMVKRYSQVPSEDSESILSSSASTILASPTSTVGPDPLHQHQHQQTSSVTTYGGAKWRLAFPLESDQKYFLLIRSKFEHPLSDGLLVEINGEPATVLPIDEDIRDGEKVTLLQVEHPGAPASSGSLVVKVKT